MSFKISRAEYTIFVEKYIIYSKKIWFTCTVDKLSNIISFFVYPWPKSQRQVEFLLCCKKWWRLLELSWEHLFCTEELIVHREVACRSFSSWWHWYESVESSLVCQIMYLWTHWLGGCGSSLPTRTAICGRGDNDARHKCGFIFKLRSYSSLKLWFIMQVWEN